jgi:hypothetical protein
VGAQDAPLDRRSSPPKDRDSYAALRARLSSRLMAASRPPTECGMPPPPSLSPCNIFAQLRW